MKKKSPTNISVKCMTLNAFSILNTLLLRVRDCLVPFRFLKYLLTSHLLAYFK
jgi:hypothetical protein